MNKVVSSTEKWIEKDRRIWVSAKSNFPNPFEDAFLEARVVEIHPKQIIINFRQANNNEVAFDPKTYSVGYDDCQKLTYGANDVADMVDLEELNQPELLFNLRRRYLTDFIFTYCGPTLVILNPYALIDKLFNQQQLFQYQTYVFLESFEFKTLPPHIFGLAAFCLWQLFENSRNQSIVISGESGAGKTENTKYCLKYLASLGKNMTQILKDKTLSKIISNKSMKNIAKKDTKLVGIEDKILGCNEILEAFGNAKTIRNDNSSRFGKLILLLYGQSQVDIKSAFIISYLLEKSRIVSVSEGERNYHIFYYFLKGLSAQQRKTYFITYSINEYRILNQSTVYSIKGISDEKKFEEVENDFLNYFSKEEIHCIFKILSIILNVGNLQFKKQFNKNNEEIAVPANKECLVCIAKLLCVEYQTFSHSFQYKSRKMGQNTINSPLKYDQAIALQNSFSKNLYQKIFIFIVGKLNEKIELQKVNLDETDKSFRKSIGILDIFGFQVLGMNSLEQFFINFANEKLQQLYVSYVFKEEQNEFIKEGLKQFSLKIDFQDNKPVIDLFENYPLGLFHLINQSSELNKPDQNLPQTMVKNHPKNDFLQIPKGKKGLFLINHSCSPVNYNTSGFTNRNKDQFPQQLLDTIINGKDEDLKKIIAAEAKAPQAKGRNAAKKFLGSKFLNQMNKLTEELYSSDCHFVRCIKPNNVKSPKTFNSLAVLQSLRYLGVLDSILIRKLGYIYRRPFKQFIKKFFQIESYIFGFAKFISGKTDQEFKEHAKKFVIKYVPNQYENRFILLGHTKILIKEAALNNLEVMAKQKRKFRIECAMKIKRMCMKSLFRKNVKHFLSSIKVLKSNLLYVKNKIRQAILKKKCSKVQKYIRKYLMEKRMQKIKQQAQKSILKIVAYLKMKKCRMAFLKIKKNTIKIQAHVRFFITMAHYFKEKNIRDIIFNCIFQKSWTIIQHHNATKIKALWKGYFTRKQYKESLLKIKKKVLLQKYKQYFMKVISINKFQKFKSLLNRYKRPIIKLQAITRGKFAHRTYKLMKSCAILIQRAYRRYLRKKYFLITKWKDYRKLIYLDQRYKLKQLSQLGVSINKIGKVKYYNQTLGCKIKLYPQQLLNRYAKNQQAKINEFINQTIQYKNKNTFQIYIGDYDIIGTQHYKGRWLQKYCKVKEDMYRKNQYPIYLDFNDQFTTLISNKDKVYHFSSSSQQINGKSELSGVTQQISLFQSGAYLVKNDKKVYSWGFNYLNCLEDTPQFVVQVKEDVELSKLQINQISAKGRKRYFVSQPGKVYYYEKTSNSNEYKLSIHEISLKSAVKTVSISYSFLALLTNNGQIYSQGSNKNGQLGLGFVSLQQIKQPTLIPYFNKSKQIIQTIFVGMGHCVAKSKLGYAYAWGNNSFSQVSNKNVEFIHTPEYLQCEQGKIKACQAVAGYRSTFVLSEHLKVLGFGASYCFTAQKSIFNVPLNTLKQTSNNKSLAQVKISCKWTRQASILLVNAIDLSRCKQGTKWQILIKYAKMMSKQWTQNKIFPPYREWIENILQLGDLKKFKFQSLSNSNIKATTPKDKSSKEQLDELKALMNLRKSSTVFKKQASQKMEELLSKLRSRPISEWNEGERQLFQYISQKKKVLK